jgi:hypothetical protein
MTINIKLMADYFSYPLWGLDNDNIGGINPHELPLSEETIAKLEQWSQIYNNILNCDDPASSSFKTIEDQANFEVKGIKLWEKLRQELGQEYNVKYHSIILHRVVSDPRELESKNLLMGLGMTKYDLMVSNKS